MNHGSTVLHTEMVCVGSENIHTHDVGHLNSQGKGKYEAKQEIPGGGGLQTKQPSMVKVWLFSEITGACFNMLQFTFQFLVSHFSLGLVCQA